MTSAGHTSDRPGLWFVPFVAALIALGPFAIDTYLPALPSMANALGTDIVRANQTLSIYLLGFAVGQLLGGPVSDQLGRRVVGLTGLTIFILCAVGIALAQDIDVVLGLRGVQAIGGGFATVICMAMVRDSYSALEAARQFPKIMMVMLTAPLVAPAIGAAMLPLGWASIFVFLAGYASLLVIGLLMMRETASHRTGQLVPGKILQQYLSVLRWRVAGKRLPLRYILSQGLISSVLMIFITHSSYIYMDYFAVPANQFVLYFAANVLAMMVGNLVTSRLILRIPPYTLYLWGRAVQFVAIILLTTAVMSAPASMALFLPLLALVIGCNGVIAPAVQGLYLAPFRELSGSASSLLNTSIFTMGGLLGAVSGLWFDDTLLPIVLTMLIALVLGNLLALTIPRTQPADHD
ncbi:MAG: multidrug effflux MFS transporter [Pseudomonadota bacterium]